MVFQVTSYWNFPPQALLLVVNPLFQVSLMRKPIILWACRSHRGTTECDLFPSNPQLITRSSITCLSVYNGVNQGAVGMVAPWGWGAQRSRGSPWGSPSHQPSQEQGSQGAQEQPQPWVSDTTLGMQWVQVGTYNMTKPKNMAKILYNVFLPRNPRFPIIFSNQLHECQLLSYFALSASLLMCSFYS